MIWLDIIDPKYVLFFKPILPKLKALDSVIVTTRESKDYDECIRLLELFKIEHHCIGGYGGASKLGKFESRLNRQKGFLELFARLNEIPKLFITGASVDGVQCAYGLGIPVVHFADTPVANEKFSLESITILSRLTLPLSHLVFHPFVVPEICYTSLGLSPAQVVEYDFIDVALWLDSIPLHYEIESPQRRAFCESLGLDSALPIILVREEEYKAHYVKHKLPIIYESFELLARRLKANVLCMPRYGKDELESCLSQLPQDSKSRFKILHHKLEPKDFYPFVDVLLGGGGTMNLEACYLGIPVISTRSLLLFHDRFLLDNALMKHAKSATEAVECIIEILSKPHLYERQDSLFAKNGVDIELFISHIKALVESPKP